jgi:hypothetical protein
VQRLIRRFRETDRCRDINDDLIFGGKVRIVTDEAGITFMVRRNSQRRAISWCRDLKSHSRSGCREAQYNCGYSR